MTASFHNKILRVHLGTGAVEVEEPGGVYFRRYLGGWNIIADVLLKEVPTGADPLGPENKLIFAPGVLTGLPISGVSRNAVGAKSPLTGGFGAAEVGGNWGAQLKRAGFDALIVEGTAAHPVYLWIKDGEVEIRDATHLWGQPTKETQAAIRTELNDQRVEVAMIGPGGENQVRYACIMNGLKDAAGRTGLGAVMGAKHLKAVAVRGSQSLEGADAETLHTLAREMAQAINSGAKGGMMHKYGTGVGIESGVQSGNLPIRNFRDGEFPGAANLSAENFMERIGIGMEGCFACAMRCKKVVKAEAPYVLDPAYGGPEYESFAALGACCGVDDIIAVAKATELCNAYSLDTISCGVTVALAMECFEHGLLTPADTDGLELRFGNGEALVQVVELIGRRAGIGALLAEGSRRVAEKLGGGTLDYAMHVKGQEYPMHEPRFKRGLAIGYAVSPTGADHCHALHDIMLVNAGADGFLAHEGLRALGILEPLALEDMGPAKVRATLYNTVRSLAGNCACLCLFVPWNSDEQIRMLRAATGWDISAYEYQKVGERALTLARLFNAREGFGPQDDRLARRSYGPTTGGALAEGGIDPEALTMALRLYYGMLGWDVETGCPTREKLAELDVAWAETYLPK